MSTKKATEVPGKEESMPGLPGPAEQIPPAVVGDEAPLEPVISAPHDGAPLTEAVDLVAEAKKRTAALPKETKAKLAELGATVKPEPKPTGPQTYKVWAHGSLMHDGKTYDPGATIELPAEIGDTLVCLEKVTV